MHYFCAMTHMHSSMHIQFVLLVPFPTPLSCDSSTTGKSQFLKTKRSRQPVPSSHELLLFMQKLPSSSKMKTTYLKLLLAINPIQEKNYLNDGYHKPTALFWIRSSWTGY